MLKAQYTRQEVVGQYQENILASLPGTSIDIIEGPASGHEKASKKHLKIVMIRTRKCQVKTQGINPGAINGFTRLSSYEIKSA